ncbi:hypothetical protein ANO11243_021690 [Dothideomycetidae sp. 11243]|nr:hypothetical protein ANO11243_021690 [fungal sp. No.11243]
MGFLGVYRAVYDYAPQGEGELEITEGDLLFVLEKSTDDDWWKAKKKAVSDDDDEPEGLIPNNYVEKTDEEISFAEDAQVDVYDISDPDWTLVGHNGEFGFAPAIYIELQSASTAAAVPAAPPMPNTTARALAPPPAPEPEEDDSPMPSPVQNPAKALAGIIAQRTGGSAPAPAAAEISREPASPPLPSRPRPTQYTPEESEEEAPPPKPRRPRSEVQYAPPEEEHYAPGRPRAQEPPGVVASPPYNRAVSDHYDEEQATQAPGGYKLFHVHEMVSTLGKNKKLPTTLGINLGRGMISISPAKSKDGPSQEWSAEKMSHYSIEGKHVFLDLVRPSKSVDFHAGAKDTATEITSMLGELAGASRGGGLREVLAAASGGGDRGPKKGHMLYEFMAQGDDEVTVAVGDEVIVLDDSKSEEWWMVRRLKNGKEGVVPSSYVEITGTLPATESASFSGVNAGRSTVEQNRLEEERITKEASKRQRSLERRTKFTDDGNGASLPRRQSSLPPDGDKRTPHRKKRDERDAPKTKPNPSRMRTWTDRSGTFRVDAEFLGLRENKIHLHKSNGVKIAVPVANMAVEDLEYVEKITGVSLDEDKPLSDIKRRSTLRNKERDAKRDTNGISTIGKSDYDWFDFFLACGVNPQICERYAQNFAKDQMGEEILPEVTPPLLRTLGLKEGDILRVMKHLDTKFGRSGGTPTEGEGGLFSGPGGALKNNTRKGRPAPATVASDVVHADAFKMKSGDDGERRAVSIDDSDDVPPPAPPKDRPAGFEDDAWSVKPTKSPAPQTAQAPAPAKASSPAPTAAATAPPPAPTLIGSLGELSLLSPPLQPTPAPQQTIQAQATSATPVEPPKPAADQAFFDRLGAPAPQNILAQPTGRARPTAPPLNTNSSSIAPPPRAASAPGFPNMQQSAFAPPTPMSAQMTGYQQPMATGFQAPPGQSLQSMQQQQQMMNGSMQMPYQQNGLMSSPTGYPGMMQPQMTGFYPQQQQQGMFPPPQPLQMQPTASPFADPPRPPFQPSPSMFASPNGMLPPALTPMRTGFTNPNLQPQATGFGNPQWLQQQQQQQQAPPPLLPGQALPPGMTLNGNGSLVPQHTGFGGQQSAPQPLLAQKTGPAPPVRFGTSGIKPLAATPTGRRANLGNASMIRGKVANGSEGEEDR